jgi:hypothetical protein
LWLVYRSVTCRPRPKPRQIPPAPDLPANVVNGTNSASRPAANTAAPASQVGAGRFKVGDIVRVPLGDGKILQVRGREYFARKQRCRDLGELSGANQAQGKLTAGDHTLGQYDALDYVQVLVEGKWVEGRGHPAIRQRLYDEAGQWQRSRHLSAIHAGIDCAPACAQGGVPPARSAAQARPSQLLGKVRGPLGLGRR